MEEGFVECTLFYCFYEKMAYVTETLKSHLADFTSVSQLVSQNEKVHTRWGWHHGPGRIGLPQHEKMGSDGSLLRF